MHSRNWIRFFHGLLPNVVEATFTPPKSRSLTKMLIPKTDRNQNLFVPSVRPSPVEMEHVSTTPDTATNPDSTSHRSKLSGHICVWSSRQACDSDNGNPGNFLYCWALRIETSLAITHPDRPHEDERMKPLTPWAVRKAAAVSRFAAQGPGAPAMRYDSAI